MTEIPTEHGKLYLATVIDLYSRRLLHVTVVYQPKFLGTAGVGPKTVSGDATILLSRVVNGAPR